MKNKVKVTIDNISVDVESGISILQAARQIGGSVVPPAMCYYSKLEGSGGKCRTCLVEVVSGSTKDPRPMPKLVPSCRTEVMDGMVVKNITSDKVNDARRGVVELLLLNHPLDCPVCDQAGECKLQDLSYEYGTSITRYEFKRRTFKKEDLGKYIQLHMNRCILCYRCTYVADQVSDNRVHGVVNRGDKSAISTYLGKFVENDFIGNVIDVCPVGALTDKTFRFKSRVWFTKPVLAHRKCDSCCGKVILWYKGSEVYRVTARKNEFDEIENWICNKCRFDTKKSDDWVIESPFSMSKKSVISKKHCATEYSTAGTLRKILKGTKPHIAIDIRDVSEVSKKK